MNYDRYFELPAPEALGPQGTYVAALVERARHLTPVEASAMAEARDNAWAVARGVARDAAWDAAWDAVLALVVRDLITTNCYDTLTRTWREVIGPIHPDDPELTTQE